MTRRRRRHWYFITYIDCPVCLRSETVRERRYGRKPKSWVGTHEFIEHWCGCEL